MPVRTTQSFCTTGWSKQRDGKRPLALEQRSLETRVVEAPCYRHADILPHHMTVYDASRVGHGINVSRYLHLICTYRRVTPRDEACFNTRGRPMNRIQHGPSLPLVNRRNGTLGVSHTLQAGGHQFESDKLHHVRDAKTAPLNRGAVRFLPQKYRRTVFSSLIEAQAHAPRGRLS